MGPNDLLGCSDPIAKQLEGLNYKGLPYVGKPFIVDDDAKPEMHRVVHIKQFDLSKEAHLTEYNEVFQKVADNKSKISFEEKVYDAELKSWRILLRWYDYIYKEPKKKKEVK